MRNDRVLTADEARAIAAGAIASRKCFIAEVAAIDLQNCLKAIASQANGMLLTVTASMALGAVKNRIAVGAVYT